MFSQLQHASASEVEALEASLPDKIMEIDGRLSQLAGLSLADAEAKFAAAVDAAKPATNATVAATLTYVRAPPASARPRARRRDGGDRRFSRRFARARSRGRRPTKRESLLGTEAAACILNLRKIERFIVLHVPKVEDGNNFGVAIQMEVNKMVGEQGKTLKGLVDALPNYYKERAGAWKEVAAKTSTETTKSKSEGEDSETKDGAASKTAKSGASSSSKTTTSSSPPNADAVAHLVALDVHWYFALCFTLESVRDAYIACGDCLEKNKQKLAMPRGEGGNAMSMF